MRRLSIICAEEAGRNGAQGCAFGGGGFAVEETRNEQFLYEMDVQGIFVTKNETVFGEYL